MKGCVSIYGDVYRYFEGKNKTVFNALAREDLYDIILDGEDVFWFEYYTYGKCVSDYVHRKIKEYLISQGYRYLYDIPLRY